MSDINFKEALDLYISGKSTYEIAQVYDTYPNKIRRMFKKHGVDLKSKSEAQKNALKSGRTSHPTEGRVRTEEERLKISSGAVDAWGRIPDEERERRKELAKKRWDSHSGDYIKEFRDKGREAIIRARHEGTKFELFLKSKLADFGYEIIVHDGNLLEGQLECDLHFPDIKTVIEVDGLHHRETLYGEEALKRVQKDDKRKDGLLMAMDYSMIRVHYDDKDSSLYGHHILLDKILSLLNQIESDKDLDNSQIFYIRVDDELG